MKNKLLSNNWAKIAVGMYISFTAIYDSIGNDASVFWVTLYCALEYLILSFAVFMASKSANSLEEMFICYGFIVFKLLNILLIVYCAIESSGDINIFWEIANHSYMTYIILGFAAFSSYGSYAINKFIK